MARCATHRPIQVQIVYHSNGDEKLANDLNPFYSRFDKPENIHTIDTSTKSSSFIISSEDTKCEFLRLPEQKAGGPDGVSPRLLRMCASQLSGVFTEIYNWSLRTCHVPSVFKNALIVPVPKKNKISTLNDYRPVALTPVAMKSFERLVLTV